MRATLEAQAVVLRKVRRPGPDFSTGPGRRLRVGPVASKPLETARLLLPTRSHRVPRIPAGMPAKRWEGHPCAPRRGLRTFVDRRAYIRTDRPTHPTDVRGGRIRKGACGCLAMMRGPRLGSNEAAPGTPGPRAARPILADVCREVATSEPALPGFSAHTIPHELRDAIDKDFPDQTSHVSSPA